MTRSPEVKPEYQPGKPKAKNASENHKSGSNKGGKRVDKRGEDQRSKTLIGDALQKDAAGGGDQSAQTKAPALQVASKVPRSSASPSPDPAAVEPAAAAMDEAIDSSGQRAHMKASALQVTSKALRSSASQAPGPSSVEPPDVVMDEAVDAIAPYMDGMDIDAPPGGDRAVLPATESSSLREHRSEGPLEVDSAIRRTHSGSHLASPARCLSTPQQISDPRRPDTMTVSSESQQPEPACSGARSVAEMAPLPSTSGNQDEGTHRKRTATSVGTHDFLTQCVGVAISPVSLCLCKPTAMALDLSLRHGRLRLYLLISVVLINASSSISSSCFATTTPRIASGKVISTNM